MTPAWLSLLDVPVRVVPALERGTMLLMGVPGGRSTLVVDSRETLERAVVRHNRRARRRRARAGSRGRRGARAVGVCLEIVPPGYVREVQGMFENEAATRAGR